MNKKMFVTRQVRVTGIRKYSKKEIAFETIESYLLRGGQIQTRRARPRPLLRNLVGPGLTKKAYGMSVAA